MRVGIIGAGGIAQAHINNLKQWDDVQLVGITDVDQARAKSVADQLGAVAYDNVDELFSRASLDAVYICVPPFAHGEPEKAAIAHKVPFYVEKPLGIDLDFAEDLAEQVDRAGLITAVGFQLRYIDTVETLRTRLKGRTLGMVLGRYACPLVSTPWWRKRAFSGGQLVEQVIHIVDLIRYVTQDEYQTVYSKESLRIHTDVEGMDIPDVTVTAVTFRSGAIGSITNTCAIPSGWTADIEVVASDLAARWNPSELTLTDGKETTQEKSKTDNPMALADRAFIDAVASGDPTRVKSDVADALLTQKAVMAAVRSAAQGQIITID